MRRARVDAVPWSKNRKRLSAVRRRGSGSRHLGPSRSRTFRAARHGSARARRAVDVDPSARESPSTRRRRNAARVVRARRACAATVHCRHDGRSPLSLLARDGDSVARYPVIWRVRAPAREMHDPAPALYVVGRSGPQGRRTYLANRCRLGTALFGNLGERHAAGVRKQRRGVRLGFRAGHRTGGRRGFLDRGRMGVGDRTQNRIGDRAVDRIVIRLRLVCRIHVVVHRREHVRLWRRPLRALSRCLVCLL